MPRLCQTQLPKERAKQQWGHQACVLPQRWGLQEQHLVCLSGSAGPWGRASLPGRSPTATGLLSPPSEEEALLVGSAGGRVMQERQGCGGKRFH